MKKINMITTLSPEKQYEIRRWFCITLFLVLCTLSVAAYFMVPQIMLYRSLQKEVAVLRQHTKDYSSQMSTKDNLKKEYDEVRVREAKISSYKQQKKNPYQHVTEIVATGGSDVQLESMKFDKKDVEIAVLCSTAEHARAFLKRLSALPHFSHMKMVSLQQDGQNKQMRCTIKGNVIF